MSPNDADGMANRVDPDQTAPLFAQACLSENLGSLRYVPVVMEWKRIIQGIIYVQAWMLSDDF